MTCREFRQSRAKPRMPLRRVALVLTWAWLLLASRPALCWDDDADELDLPAPITGTAKPPSPASPPVRETGQRWYGWQVLLADCVALGLIAFPKPRDPLGGGTATLVGGQVYVFGPGLVHAVGHDKPLRGLASLGLRLGLPALGWSVGLQVARGICADGSGTCSEAPVYVGLAGGFLAALALDAAWLAWDEEPPPAPAKSVQWGPFVAPATDGGWAGVQGRF